MAAGGMMAPAVLLAGLALWHPSWPRVIRWVLAVIVLANLVPVSLTITSDFGVSWRSLVGICGLVLIYGCIVWAAEAIAIVEDVTEDGTVNSPVISRQLTWALGEDEAAEVRVALSSTQSLSVTAEPIETESASKQRTTRMFQTEVSYRQADDTGATQTLIYHWDWFDQTNCQIWDRRHSPCIA